MYNIRGRFNLIENQRFAPVNSTWSTQFMRVKHGDVDVQVGQAMQSRRVERGLSVQYLSQISKISEGRLARFEQGSARARVAELAKIADCLAVPIGVFFQDWLKEGCAKSIQNRKTIACGGKFDS
ncbi:MAG: ribosome-binding protein aMBF1 (putative translation factor) [Hyphomicrobiaceae bacterium]